MGIGDLFKASENKSLRQRVDELEAMMTPEMRDLDILKGRIKDAEAELLQRQNEISAIRTETTSVINDLATKKAQLVETDEQVLLQEFGLYQPKYDFESSDIYKDRLSQIREQQKRLVKGGSAATGNTNWTVNNNAAQGKKMVGDMQKLLLRAFNTECDAVIGSVKFNNVDASIKRITTSRDAISKLGTIMGVAVTDAYYNLKIDELYLSHEYQLKKQEEKEEQKRAREELREQAKLQREIEEARREIEKEQKHYSNALKKLESQLEGASEEQQAVLLAKKAEIEQQLSELDKSLKDVDYRAANQKAGYVYVISNLGAFGENVYKIGMTRRLDPMDRIDELGDASVPFNFDVHAMIFTEDAPGLEAALHRAFDDRKLNMINTRREFFRVSLDEIEEVIRKSYDKTVEFTRIPPAEQYRQSLKMKDSSANPAMV